MADDLGFVNIPYSDPPFEIDSVVSTRSTIFKAKHGQAAIKLRQPIRKNTPGIVLNHPQSGVDRGIHIDGNASGRSCIRISADVVLRMYHAKMLRLTAILWSIPPAWKSPEIGAGLMSAGTISGIRGIRMSHHPELSQCRPRRMSMRGVFTYGVQSVYYVLEGIQERAEYLSYMPERPGIMGFISLAVF